MTINELFSDFPTYQASLKIQNSTGKRELQSVVLNDVPIYIQQVNDQFSEGITYRIFVSESSLEPYKLEFSNLFIVDTDHYKIEAIHYTPNTFDIQAYYELICSKIVL